MEIIARIHTDLPTKFGLPRQSGLVEELEGLVVFEPKYREPEALRGLRQSADYSQSSTGLPQNSAIARILFITALNFSGVSDCAPSLHACSGSMCTSISSA